VEFGALLHDVGKIGVPKEIVNKPGPLSDDEWDVMRRHTITGQRMLDRVGGALQDVGAVVRASHERWDGSGYPDGLAGEEIPIAARIVCAADAFSAMTTDRPYRAARDREYAIGELRAQTGLQFDPAVVAATLTVIERYGLPRRATTRELDAPELETPA
jgi:HD-GYP domain-containing protein (c-di-GMP phosphodiesterase class II)